MPRSLSQLPADVRPLVLSFRDGVQSALADDLVGMYLLGSIAFERGGTHKGDVDFYVVTSLDLSADQRLRLAALHRSLASTFARGNDLDGLYISVREMREGDPPRGIGFGASGRSRGADDPAWALHRAHIHRGAFLRLSGTDARRIFPPVSFAEIGTGLDQELHLLRVAVSRHPAYCTLNLCRLLFSWTKGDPVVSKVAAAGWAQRQLPAQWRPLVASGLRVYQGRGSKLDVLHLRRDTTRFFEFASTRIASAKKQRRFAESSIFGT